MRMIKIPVLIVLFVKMTHCFAGSDGTFLIYNAHKNQCLGDSLQELTLCNPQDPKLQFRWTSENRIFNVAQKKCLGTGVKSEGNKLQWFICDSSSDFQKWECQNNTLFGLKNESLYLSLQGDTSLLILSTDPGDKGKWTIHGTTGSVCSRPYEELYTLKGNALGRPCNFPFHFNNKWYTNCITDGRSSKQPWCAIENEYEPNQLWGFCPTQEIVEELWRKSPVTDVYYQLNQVSFLNWYQARKSCQQQGGDLLSITEPHEQTFISGLTENTGPALWTGLNSLDASSGWRWVNGQPLRYLKWLSGQPSSLPGHSCGVLSQFYDSEWSTALCSERHGYICQRGISTPTVPPAVHTGSCTNPWIPYSGHCYLLYRTKRTWQEAKDTCRHEGGDLLSILSVEEQSFVISQLGYSKTDEVWIGFNDLKTKMLFEWSDDSSVPFVFWDKNEPSDKTALKEDCVIMRGEEGKWADQICQKKYGYICKIKTNSDKSSYITSTGCKPGWMRYGYYCYLTGAETKTFEESKQTCEKAGSYLVDITDRIENAFLVSLIGAQSDKHFWIGLSNQKYRHVFEWTNTKEVSFTHFNEEMPGGKQGCVAMTTGVLAGLWDVLSCTNAEKYICKQKAEGVITTLAPPTTSPLGCSEGWYPLVNRHYCFKLYKVERNKEKMWFEALDFCRETGGDLLSLHSSDDIPVIHRKYFPLTAWIGYNLQNPTAGYTWSDGSPTSYESWARGEPNNLHNREKCVTMHFNKQYGQKEEWEDLQCEDRNAWYCEIRKGVTPKEVNITSKKYNKTKDSWTIFRDNQYYIFDGHSVSMDEGREYCRSRHSDLVVINDEEERIFLWHWIKATHKKYYIGLYIDLDKSLSWMDGSPVVFQAWAQNQPAFLNNDEHCVKMSYSHGLWESGNCGDSEMFICKRNGSVPAYPPSVLPELPKGGCAPDWMKFQTKCYKIGQDLKTWEEARSFCRSLGGTLASINNKFIQAFLTSKMDDANTPDLWHGLNNLVEKRIRWTDGSRYGYTAFAKSADDHIMYLDVWKTFEDNLCGVMGGTQRGEVELGKWWTKDCKDTSGYICSRALDPFIEPSSTEDPRTFIKLGNSFYMIVQTNLTWKEAQQHCESDGSNLASIQEAFVQSYIELKTYELGRPLWIGLNSEETDGYFQWIDKWHLNMEYWSSNEPKMDNPCAYADVGGAWKTAQCNQTYYSLCKKSEDIAPTPPALYSGMCPSDTEEEPPMAWLPFKGHCYAFVKRSVSWTTASKMCIKRGANLVSILDPVEAKFLAINLRQLRNDYRQFWIGLFKNHAGRWLWVDNSVLDYSNIYQSIAPHEFAHLRYYEESLHCALVSTKSMLWPKERCDHHAPFICKTSKVMLPPTKIVSTGKTGPHRVLSVVSLVLVIAVLCVLAGLAFMYRRCSKRTCNPE